MENIREVLSEPDKEISSTVRVEKSSSCWESINAAAA